MTSMESRVGFLSVQLTCEKVPVIMIQVAAASLVAAGEQRPSGSSHDTLVLD